MFEAGLEILSPYVAGHPGFAGIRDHRKLIFLRIAKTAHRQYSSCGGARVRSGFSTLSWVPFETNLAC
jgi:hypothetical protein